MSETKPFIISKHDVMKAYQLVKGNAGAAGVDKQSLQDFELNLKDNLYKLWNRLSSGSYFPEAVRGVAIPKKSGGERLLGVPTVTDRIAQMVVKLAFEPSVEPHFHKDSYGYRPNKSALEAVGVTRERCWRYDWLLEYDIKGLFDNLDHELLMKAVKKHTESKWIILYIERWLTAPMQMPDGQLVERTKGVPQGGVISPVLSNLYLHYVFDVWMEKKHPSVPWCRYADDGVVHCKTEEQARQLLAELAERFKECELELHSDKTKIVYCKAERGKDYSNKSFEFLGYCFRRRMVKNSKKGNIFLGFTPAVSQAAQKAMRAKTRGKRFYSRTEMSLNEIAKEFNPVLRGWLAYYGRYNCSALRSVMRHFNKTLVSWAMHKYKKLRGHKTRASRFIAKIAEREPTLFAHWELKMMNVFA